MKIAAAVVLVALSCAGASAFMPQHPSSPISMTRLFMARKPFITGNWKLNPSTRQEAVELATGIANAITSDSPCDVALFVPYPFIEAAQQAVNGKLLVGAEVSFTHYSYMLPVRPGLNHISCFVKCSFCTYFTLNLVCQSRGEWSFHRRNIATHVEIHWRHLGLGWSFGTSND